MSYRMHQPCHRGLVVGLIALLGAGCAENAFLELQIELPPQPSGDTNPWWAQIQVRNAEEHPFNIEWTGGDLETVELGGQALWDCLSVESGREGINLHVRVRFCRAENCLDLMDSMAPQRWLRLETPFYVGRRTYYRESIAAIPVCETAEDCNPGSCIDQRCGCRTNADCCPDESCGFVCDIQDGEPQGNCVHEVDRCSIEGCIDGESVEFCRSDDGTHFCENSSSADRPFECER